MQRRKVCRKLMAFVLTLCMVLPLISNQYLVVRAEETGDTAVTKKLSDLVQEHKYVTVDMTQGEDVILTNQKWSSEEYEYATSTVGESDAEMKVQKGTLYQVKLKAGQAVYAKQEINPYSYWYEEENVGTKCASTYMPVFGGFDTEKTVYYWLPKENVYNFDIPEEYTISFLSGDNIADYKDRAIDISNIGKIPLNKSADNYVKNIAIGAPTTDLSNGWIYKSNLQSGYYSVEVENSDADSDSAFRFLVMDDACKYVSMSDGYSDESKEPFDILINKDRYIFIEDKSGDQTQTMSFDLKAAKKLSELGVTELKKGETYTTTSSDKNYNATDCSGSYSIYNIFSISLKPNEDVYVSVKRTDVDVALGAWGQFVQLNDDRAFLDYSKTYNVPCMRFNNTTSETQKYYIGIPAISGTKQYVIQYNDLPKLADCEENAITLSEDATSKSITMDNHMTAYVSEDAMNPDGIQAGALVKIAVPANTGYKFEFNGSSNRYYHIYEDLNNEENKITIGTASTILENSGEQTKYYYAWIQDSQWGENPTVSIEKINYKTENDIEELKLGETPISGDMGVYVCTNANGEKLNGYMYKYTVPKTGNYAVGLKRSSELDSRQYLYAYEVSEDGNWNKMGYCASTNKDVPMDAFSGYLANGKTYYFYINNENYNQKDENKIQDVSIFIRNDVPSISEYIGAAEELAFGETMVSSKDNVIMDINRYICMGKVYKVTLKDEMQVDVGVDAGHLAVYDQTAINLGHACSLDIVYKDGYQLSGTIQNSSGADKIYYVVTDDNTNKITIGEKTSLPTAVPIEQADIHKLSVDNPVKQASLKKQRISYDGYDYASSDASVIKKESYWIKISVPKDKIYTIQASIPEGSMGNWNFSKLQYDNEKKAYTGYGIGSVSNGCSSLDVGAFSEGEYYVYISGEDGLLSIGLSLKEIKKVTELKSQAVAIADDDIQKGSFTIDKLDGLYAHKGYGGYTTGNGNLAKITVPANTTYIVTVDRLKYYTSLYVYEADQDEMSQYSENSVFLQNLTNNNKVYYVWFAMSYSESKSVTATIQKSVMLNDKFESAEKLKKNQTSTYQYNKNESAYMNKVSYADMSSTYTYKNAKLYCVEGEGCYTLSIKSEAEAPNMKLVIFSNKGAWEAAPKLEENKQIDLDFYLLPGEKKYILLSEDTDTPSAKLELKLTDVRVDRRVWLHTDEAKTLNLGENKMHKKSEQMDYVYKLSYCENEAVEHATLIHTYDSVSGVLYKYVVEPYSTMTIKAEDIRGRVFVFENIEDEVSTFFDVWKDTQTYTVYNGDVGSKEIYFVVSVIDDSIDGTITVESEELSDDISEYENQAGELNLQGKTIVESKISYRVSRPISVNGTPTSKKAMGQLFKLDVPAKYGVTINATGDAGIAVYSDLTDAPVVDKIAEAVFNSLAADTKSYYVWIESNAESVDVTVNMQSLDPKPAADGKKIETVIPTNSGDVTISEVKDTTASDSKVSSATIQVSAKSGSSSSDAIKESIKLANQYNSDNEDVAKSAKVTSIQTTYTDDTQAIISADVVEKLQSMENPVDLEVSKMDGDKVAYTWKMKADSIENIADTEVMNINTKVEVKESATDPADEKTINDLANNEKVNKQVVEFAHDGKLPEKTEVTVAVDTTKFTDTVYYFHFYKEKNALVYTGKADVKNGYVTMVLDHCSNYVMFNENVCSHPDQEITGAKAPTCTEDGYSGDKVCKACDTIVKPGETIPAKGHTKSEEKKDAKEATCGADGYTGDVYCTVCNTLVEKGTVIPKTGKHTAGEWEGEKAATTTEEGSRIKKCTVCGEVVDREPIAKLPAPTPTPVVTPDVTVSYRTHVQSIGWQGVVTNGTMSGTSGKAKRLEGIEISVAGNSNLGIQYTTHCQSYGWLPWSANGEMNGTEGEAKRLEAIKIQLTGSDKDKYNVYYRVHAQSYGWLAWAANGAPAGTAGLAKRLEAIQIVIVKKGESFDHAIGNIQSARGEAYIASSTANANPVVTGENNVNVEYRTHVQSFGWQGWKYNGVMSGTSGKAKRLEGINIKLTNKPYSGSIVYTTHVQSIGWQGNENNVNTWFRDGQMAGTSGRAKRLEAIRIALTGEMAEHYDVYYRVHAQSFGWLDWTKNGEAAGTAGLAKRLEGIQIVLVPKGGAAPARNYGGVVTINNNSYIKR